MTAHPRVTGPIVLATFRQTVAAHGIPASTLTDNGMVFTTRLSPAARAAATRFETRAAPPARDPEELPTQPPHHLRQGRTVPADHEEVAPRQPDQPATIAELQTLLDRFADDYNHRRPHRSLPHRATPATAYTARPKATPGDRDADTHDRVRHDRIDKTGEVTLRHGGRLHHIGIGRTHARTHVLVLVHDLDIRIIDAATGELLRELTLDPTSATKPPADHPAQPAKQQTAEPTNVGSAVRDVLRHHMSAPGRIRTCDPRFRKPLLYPLSYGGQHAATPIPRGTWDDQHQAMREAQ